MDLQTFNDFQRSLNDVFQDFGNDSLFTPFRYTTVALPSGQNTGRALSAPTMNCDVISKENEYWVHADLPGVNKEDVSVNVENGMIQISAERHAKTEDRGDNWVRRERQYGKMTRSLRVPEDADAENITAKFDNGELSVTLPKRVQKTSNRITIE